MTQIKDTNKFESEMWEVNGKIWFCMVTHGCMCESPGVCDRITLKSLTGS